MLYIIVKREVNELKFYTIEEVAKMLKVSHMTIRREIERGNLKAGKVGHVWRITEEELKRYLNREE